ncbi:MAG: kynureninase [Aureliella sp.]
MNNEIYRSAAQLDLEDPLRCFREQFLFPTTAGRPDVYFVGNSLGLQPKATIEALKQTLDLWQHSAVHGHFEAGESGTAWMDLPERISEKMAPVVGAEPSEVVVMNTLTVNLHLMMASFYRPDGQRNKILIESHAFPSDHQAVYSHLRMRGIDPDAALVVVPASDKSFLFSTASILEQIERHRESLALILLPGVQYYTGQVLEMDTITARAREYGIAVGWDLAHAAGNIPLELSKWGPDFACWCTYKYMNGGPGSLGGCYIRKDHATDINVPRLAGWWGHERASRFEMRPEFVAEANAHGWQLSNPPILSLAALEPALDLFRDAGGIHQLREKSIRLSNYFRQQLSEHCNGVVDVLTPSDCSESGCQLSLEIVASTTSGREIYDALGQSGIHTDWREPNVIRAAPVPLYNSFQDIERFVARLAQLLS